MLTITLHVAYSSNVLLLYNKVYFSRKKMYSLKPNWIYTLGTCCAHIKLIL